MEAELFKSESWVTKELRHSGGALYIMGSRIAARRRALPARRGGREEEESER